MMGKTMQGIDVSSWQAGINLAAVRADFVIVKATQGCGYTNPCFREQCDGALAAGRLLGCYLYVAGTGAKGEARHFVSTVRKYLERAVLAIDWEADQNAKWGNTAYLREVAAEVIRLTGVRPLIYASASTFPWAVARGLDCEAWLAQYASNDATGYQGRPWNEGAYSCAIRQYSRSGRLAGWGGALDLDKAYMDARACRKYAKPAGNGAGGKGVEKKPEKSTAARAKAALARKREAARIERLARKVIKGKYGDGEERKRRLGKDYAAVQKAVNRLLK